MPVRSTYLTMRDGAHLAVDVHLPAGVRDPVPAVLHQTRYFRRVAWGRVARALGVPEFLDVSGPTRAAFVRAGYAWVDVDVRGSGASSGSRPSPWWRDEVRDGAEVVDWIVAQPWCSGAVGATGVSYAGTAAELLLANRHPAVKAVIPRFSLYDVYADVAFPGGLHLSWFTETWARFNAALDRNDFAEAIGMVARINAAAVRDIGEAQGALWAGLAAWADGDGLRRLIAAAVRLAARGVASTDDDPGGRRLAAAVREHSDNVDVHARAADVTYRDDAGLSPVDPTATVDAFSPHAHRADVEASGAAVYSYSGWLDGAYQHAAIKRHMNLPRGRAKLIVGPWDHGGRQNISPFEPGVRATFDHAAEMLRFFDHYLKGVDTGAMGEPPVRYYTMGAEAWRTADRWPPPETAPVRWYFAAGGALATTPDREPGADDYRVDPEVGTGVRSRWRSLIGVAAPLGYGDRAAGASRLLCYTSAPLPEDVEVTGHPVVALFLESTADDAGVFVYLEDVAPGGRVTYVTEGQLRALHRAVSDAGAGYRTAVPPRTFARADARPLPRGEPAELVFDLLPVSYRFARGHAIRVAVAGADADHFAPVPGTAGARWRVRRGGARGSRIELPVMGAAGG